MIESSFKSEIWYVCECTGDSVRNDFRIFICYCRLNYHGLIDFTCFHLLFTSSLHFPKIPLVIFKREKEVARQLEFNGMYIAEQPEDDDIKSHWDKLVISAK